MKIKKSLVITILSEKTSLVKEYYRNDRFKNLILSIQRIKYLKLIL